MAVHGATLLAFAGSKTWLANIFLNELAHLRANDALPLAPGLLLGMLLGELFLEAKLAVVIISTLRVAGTCFGTAQYSGSWESDEAEAETCKTPCAQHRL